MVFSLFSYAFITADMSCNLFKDVLTRIDKAKEENDRIVHNKNIVKKDEFESFTE